MFWLICAATSSVAELIADVFPPGVFNFVAGGDKEGHNVGTHLVNSKEIRKVSFTGSVATGKAIMAASANDVKRVTLELGGNDPAIIRADVDIAQVAPEVFSGAFSNTGQICCAIKRAYVHESIYDEFVAAISEEAKKATLTMGDGFDETTEFGPLNNEMQFTKVQGIVADAKASGATINTGGKVMDGAGKGYFYEPTIISDVMEGTRIVDEEQVRLRARCLLLCSLLLAACSLLLAACCFLLLAPRLLLPACGVLRAPCSLPPRSLLLSNSQLVADTRNNLAISSVRYSRSSSTLTTRRPSPGRTTRTSASAARSGRRISARQTRSPTASKAGLCGSTST